ncbi:farnesol dehydrogenase-like [Planococcus citri]|uniref:farnesol dehydrogenase-like n=1 Tax=Planococcus citri TaxID=170843 RepID=UPI0031F913DC
MQRFFNKVAVVTGSSSGIGAAISRELVKNGLRVVGLARRIEKLKELGEELSGKFPGEFHALKCDVTKESEIESSFKWITAELGPITVLVNNAGTLGHSLLTEVTGELISQVFDTNVKAAMLWSKLAVRSMTENAIEGHIINVNSLAGHYMINTDPNLAQIYTSSKHALKIYSEALRRELFKKQIDVKVTNFSPGLVITEMTADTGLITPSSSPKTYLIPREIAETIVLLLSTPPKVSISELTVVPIRQKL